MWLFGSKNKQEFGLSALRDLCLELSTRLKALELQHEDLHAAYRRLRASDAANERHRPRNGTRDPRGEVVDEVPSEASASERKQALRMRYLPRREQVLQKT